jgi:hypothetical protein
MKKISLAILAFAGIFLASCSEDEDSPVNAGAETIALDLESEASYKFYPLAVGNYWIYQTEYVNEDGQPYDGTYKDSFENSTDSVFIVRAVRYKGKDAYELLHKSSDGSEQTSYYTLENDMVYSYSELTDEQRQSKAQAEAQGSFAVYPEGWLPFFSSTVGSENTIWYEEFNNSPQQGVTMSGVYDYKFNTVGITEGELMGNTVNMLNIDYNYIFDVNYEVGGIPNSVPPMYAETTYEARFAENIGMAYFETDLNGFNPFKSYMESMGEIPDGFEFPVLPIMTRTLIRYNIN